MDQHGDARSLLSDVIEFEHDRIDEPTVDTLAGAEEIEYVPARGRPATLPCCMRLPPVQCAPSTHVLGSTFLAACLLSVEAVHR